MLLRFTSIVWEVLLKDFELGSVFWQKKKKNFFEREYLNEMEEA